jgi:hypothetical protein
VRAPIAVPSRKRAVTTPGLCHHDAHATSRVSSTRTGVGAGAGAQRAEKQRGLNALSLACALSGHNLEGGEVPRAKGDVFLSLTSSWSARVCANHLRSTINSKSDFEHWGQVNVAMSLPPTRSVVFLAVSGEDAPRPYLENLIVLEIKTNK